MNILFTVCGRAGSKGFKNKNLKKMNGIPLVYYTLAAIKEYIESYPQDNVTITVNTDSQPLIEIIKKQTLIENIVFVDRKRELAGDIVAKVDVIKDTFLAVNDKECEMIVDLDITSPMRTVEDIRNAIMEFRKNSKYEIVYSVVAARRSPYFNMVEESVDGYYHKICEGNLTARQQGVKCYELNASIYVYSPTFLAGSIVKPITQYNAGISVMKDYLVLDIDSEEDFEMMELLYEFYCDKDEELKAVYERAKYWGNSD